MKTIVMGVVALLLATPAALAAVQYEYFQTSRSDSDGVPATDFSARAVIDGQRSRVEFVSGTAYPPGTYVISVNGAKKLLFVDPTQKTYTEVNTVGIANAIGSSNIKIENLQPLVQKLDDTKIIAGIPTDHYRLTINYDITVQFRSMPIKQSVRTTIDKWTTVRFGDGIESAMDNPIQTGNPKVDELLAAETTKIKGFALKQTVQVVTISNIAGKSKVELPATRTRTREMTVTSISEIKPDDKLFAVPADYRKVDFAEQVSKTQTQVLSTQPMQP